MKRFADQAHKILGLPSNIKYQISDDEAMYLSSPQDSEDMMMCLPPDFLQSRSLHVLDAFSSVGGNTMYFMYKCMGGSVIHAVQRAVLLAEKQRFRNLDANIKLCEEAKQLPSSTVVQTFKTDIHSHVNNCMAENFHIDLMFLDPPWSLKDPEEYSTDKELCDFMQNNIFFNADFRPHYLLFKLPHDTPDELFQAFLSIDDRKYKRVGARKIRKYYAFAYELVHINVSSIATASKIELCLKDFLTPMCMQ